MKSNLLNLGLVISKVYYKNDFGLLWDTMLWEQEKQVFSKDRRIPSPDSLQWPPDSDRPLLFHKQEISPH
jgi:hypothetical protein